MASKRSHFPRKSVFSYSPHFVLPIIFFSFVCVRFLLAYFLSNGPTVYIDEGLYTNLARSIAHSGSVEYRGQPIEYVYLVYPLLLAPLYYLPAQINLYRLIQLFNTLLICSSLFPAYLAARKVGASQKNAYIIGILTLLMPEMGFSMYLTVESLIYPFILWQFYIACLYSHHSLQTAKSHLYLFLLAALGGISYFVKPICLIFSVSFLMIVLIRSIIIKKKKEIFLALCAFALTLAVVLIGYELYALLFGRTSLMNLYEKQIPTLDGENIFIIGQGFVFHILSILFCCGGAYILVPIFGRNSLQSSQKLLLDSCVLALTVSCVSIAILIVPYQFSGSVGVCPVHTRYLMELTPCLLILLISPNLERFTCTHRKVVGCLLFIITCLFIFPGAFSMFSTQAGTFNSPSLIAYYSHRLGKGIGIAVTVTYSALMFFFARILLKKGWTLQLRNIVLYSIAVFFTINGICFYYSDVPVAKIIEQDSQEIVEMTDDKNMLIITNNYFDDFRGYQLDAHLHKPSEMVVFNNVMLNALNSNGGYTPFVPLIQAPNTSSHQTSDVDWLLFDVPTSSFVELMPTIQTQKSSGGLYTLIKIEKDQPYLKTALASIDGYVLHHQDSASLLIFDEDLRKRGWITLNITLQTYRGDSSRVTFSSSGQSETVEVSNVPQVYSITLPFQTGNFFDFTISATEDISVIKYTTE